MELFLKDEEAGFKDIPNIYPIYMEIYAVFFAYARICGCSSNKL